MIHHVTRATRHLVFWTLVFVAVSLSSVRLILAGVDRYKVSLENRMGSLIGAPVHLKRIGAKMRGVSPELVLKDVGIYSNKPETAPVIHFKEVRFGIDLADMLFKRDVISSSWVTLVGAKLVINRKPDGRFSIEGLDSGNGPPLWLFQGRQYKLLHSQITLNGLPKALPSLVLDSVNVAILNEGENHRINLLTQLPEQYGIFLKAAAAFQGRFDDLSNLSGSLFVEGNRVKFPKHALSFLPLDIEITQGAADFKLWTHWRHTQPVDVKTDMHLFQTTFTRPGRGNFHVNKLDAQFHLQLKEQDWRLDLNRFLLESQEENKSSYTQWPDLKASLGADRTPETVYKNFKLFAERLDLSETAKLVSFFAPLTEDRFRRLEQARPSGLIKAFSLYTEPETKQFALAGFFDKVNIEPMQSESGFLIPAIKNLSGQLKGGDQSGKVLINSKDVHFTAPQWFNNPLIFNEFNGLLEWTQDHNEWALSSRLLQINSPVFDSGTRMLIRLPKAGGEPFLDLQSAFKSNDIKQIATYMPGKIMGNNLRTWLERAFISGKITKGGFLFSGNVNDLPFKDSSGIMEAALDIDAMELNFNPQWPHISSITGQLFYDHNAIHGLFNHGKMGNAEITKTEFVIADLGSKTEQVVIKGGAQGEINEVLNVLQQSPLAHRLTPFVAGAALSGTTKGVMELTVPLWPGHEMKLDGYAQFQNAELTVKQLDLKIDKIVGPLKYNMQGIYSEGIQASALNHPIQVNVAQTRQATAINVEGKAKITDVEKLFGWSIADFAEGEGTYQLRLDLPKTNTDTEQTQLAINSTLEGVSLKLPGFLAKTAGQQKPSTLAITFNDDAAMPVEFNYNNDLKAALNLDTVAHKINSGHILAGTGNVMQRRVPGIKFEVDKTPLPLQDWLALAMGREQNKAAGYELNEIKIESASANWKKTRLGPFELTLKRDSNYWSGAIDSSIAKGTFQLPLFLQGPKPINMTLDLLNLSAIRQFKQQSVQTETDFKPLFTIRSNKTLWQTANLGRLSLETTRSSQGITIKQLDLEGNDAKLKLTGDWKDNRITSSTHLKGKLDMNKADRLFDKLNITKDLTETAGVIDFDLNWNGAPWQFTVPDLRGHMTVNLTNGRILSIEPGFGRLLGILAMAQWLKRLQLDFSDVFQEGLTFNSIKGRFDLMNGKALTSDLVIDAIPATIQIIGDTDLVKQSVDHTIKVVPKSSDAIPIAGTIVGEVASMVGKTLTGKSQEGFFFGKQYKVKGSWDDAKIISLHENDGVFQKTWNSITDFSWLGLGSDNQK